MPDTTIKADFAKTITRVEAIRSPSANMALVGGIVIASAMSAALALAMVLS